MGRGQRENAFRKRQRDWISIKRRQLPVERTFCVQAQNAEIWLERRPHAQRARVLGGRRAKHLVAVEERMVHCVALAVARVPEYRDHLHFGVHRAAQPLGEYFGRIDAQLLVAVEQQKALLVMDVDRLELVLGVIQLLGLEIRRWHGSIPRRRGILIVAGGYRCDLHFGREEAFGRLIFNGGHVWLVGLGAHGFSPIGHKVIVFTV